MRTVLTAALAAAALHAAVWYGTHEAISPADVRGPIESLSYSPYVGDHDPKDNKPVSVEQIREDLGVVSQVAQGVRTYSVLDGVDQVPAIAESLGLNVSLGAWVGDTPERDQSEIDTVVALAKQHRNVRSVLVGNEVMYRGERTVDQMISAIREVKRQVRVPVSTGEIWNIWLEYPKLVNAVDFIAVHLLPYWEGIPPEEATKYALDRFEQLRKAYPGKRIVIAEFGWPSQGYNRFGAEPGQLAQAEIVRKFVAEAQRRGIEYNLVEAFDQEWKTNEGSVGAHWGLFDAGRSAKFPLTGMIEDNGLNWKAGVALALGLILTFVGLRSRRVTFKQAAVFAISANAMAAAIALTLAYPFETYLNTGILVMWGVGMIGVVPLALLTLAKVYELSEVLLGRRPSRLVVPRSMNSEALTATGRLPKVSIHIPAYREPAEMVIETLNSVAALDYPNFEAVIIVNNTPEAHYSVPVAQRCHELGERFKFLNITCSGFKAGAMNVAMHHTADDAEIIAVIDADYVVERNWLKDLVPCFDDPQVALVQGPQDHRDGDGTPLKRIMNSEYAGFFDIGMVQRNEDDAIIQHGTMCLVRRSAFEAVGGWNTDTIVEDTDLGLRLYEAGYEAVYTNHRYGRGLLPDTYKAFKTQRFRWAYGAMQLIRKHWTHMLPGSTTLRPAQKFHFLSGWCMWLADAVGTLAALLNLLWVPVLLLVGVFIPTIPFTLPIIAAFVVNLLHCALLYGKRVDVAVKDIPGAAVASMSVQWTVAKAVFFGLIKDRLPFLRTEKGGNASAASANPAFWETVIGVLLAASALALIALNHTDITEMKVLAATLAIQSLPFLAASFMVAIERIQSFQAHRSKVAQKPRAASVSVGVNADVS